MSTLLICNVQLVNEGLIQEADVFIKDGRIDRIGSDLRHLASDRYIDGLGNYLLPGIIDTQSRLSASIDPFESIKVESKASVAGGITSSMLLPSHGTDLQQSFIDLGTNFRQISSLNNFSVYHLGTHNNLKEIASLDTANFCGVYVDMASNNDAIRVDDHSSLERIFKESPSLVALHAEDAPSIFESEESYRQIYGDSVPFQLHGSIRSAEACYLAASEALNIALSTNSRAHILNVSSLKEIELLSRIRQQSSVISVDVCSHYLAFSDVDCMDRGSLLKCRPSIKSDIDRAALMQGLLDNDIDSICSGHTPVSLVDKQGQYFDVPSGLPLAQYTFPSILEHYQDQILSLEVIVQKTSHAVADRYGVVDRGYIREGYWADLVLVDLEGSFIARDEDVFSEAGWTIFNGNEFRSSVTTTIVNGCVVFKDGTLVSKKEYGRSLKFDQKAP
jgi:dihydroorotase